MRLLVVKIKDDKPIHEMMPAGRSARDCPLHNAADAVTDFSHRDRF